MITSFDKIPIQEAILVAGCAASSRVIALAVLVVVALAAVGVL